MSISRRKLIQYGVGGGAALFLAGGGWLARRGRAHHPNTELRVLDPYTYSTLASIAERMCASREGLPTARELGVAEQVDALLSRMDPGDVRDLMRVLRWMESPLSGDLWGRSGRPFSECGPEVQDRILESWRTSGWDVQRTAFDALHALCQAPYWGHPKVWAHVGYGGPPDFSALVGGTP